jgi:2-polyprenyl-6-methoxyphenol hydroxylase-like FAD-dependent oxidoreductase
MSQNVLVVGADLVGLTKAAKLERYGVPVRIIDGAVGHTDKSKAIVLGAAAWS